MKTLKLAVIFLFLLITGSRIAKAQDLQPSYGIGMDISNLHVQSIAQDSVGYIWMATSRGLNCIDAYKKSRFYFHNSFENSLSDDNTYFLHVSSNGDLFVFTRFNVDLFNRFSRNFIRLKGPKGEFNFTCAEDGKNGKIWLGCRTFNYLSYINRNNNRIYSLYIPQLKGQVRGICSDDKGMLWISLLPQKETVVFDPVKKRIIARYPGLSLIFRGPKRNQLFALTSDNKIELLNSAKRTVSRILLTEKSDIVAINITADHRLCFLTQDMTFSLYDKHSGSFVKKKISGINSVYNITSLMVDRQSNIWIGTFEEGYLFIPIVKRTFDWDEMLDRHFRNQFVTFLTSDGRDRYWIATRHNGLHEYNRKTDTDKVLLNLHLTDEESAIACCFHDTRHRLWVATVDALYCYDVKTGTSLIGKYKKIVKPRYITEDKAGNIWIVCEGNGGIWMSPVNSRKGTFIRPFCRSVPRDANVTFFRQLHSGKYIFSCYSDNVYIGDRNGHVHSLLHTKNPVYQSFLKSVIYIYEDSKNVIWLGTYGNGMMRCDMHTGLCRIYTMANGLPSNDVLSIVEDPVRHVLWMSTSYGLSRFNGFSFMNYFAKDGLLGNQYHERAVYLDRGILYFMGNHGITSFSPRMINTLHDHVPFVIESLETDNHTYNTTNLHSALKLNYYENSFTVSFMGFDYSSANSLQYSYILDGYEKKWSAPSTNNTVKFSDLPSGTYYLKVRAVDNSGCWNSKMAILKIVIYPAPWATWWAILIYIIIILYCLYAGMRFYINYHVDKERIKLSKQTLMKERELNHAKINFFENVSHELRTPLGLIYGPFCELKKGRHFTKKENDYMSLMEKNIKHLMMLVEQILNFSHLKSETLSLSVSRKDVVGIVLKILDRYKGENEEKHILTSFICPEEKLIMYVDEDKLDKILSNLLSNAFKYTPSNGTIKVSLQISACQEIKNRFRQDQVLDSDYALFSVADNGIGIEKDEADKIFDRFYRSKNGESIVGSGIGLYYVKCLVKKHKGLIKAECNDSGGTTFLFCLPVSENIFQDSEKEKVLPANMSEDQPVTIVPRLGTEPDEPESAEPDRDKPSLLIVDDEPNFQTFLSDLLQPYYVIDKAFNGQEGLEKTLELIPDMIVMDVMMPLMNGYELCDKIKNDPRTCHIPVVMLTAKSNVSEHIEGMNSGADIYISKPFHPDYLLSVLRGVIANRKRMQHIIVDKSRDERSAALERLNDADRQLLEHLDEKIKAELNNSELSVDVLASELNFSHSTFYRKIKSLTGLSPNDYVRMYRLRAAAKFIESGSFNLAEIANKTGFGTQSYFSALFKKYYGMTPSEYKMKK